MYMSANDLLLAVSVLVQSSSEHSYSLYWPHDRSEFVFFFGFGGTVEI